MIRARIPGIVSFINRNIDDLEAELSRLGRSVAVDAGVRRILLLFTINISENNSYIFSTLPLILSGPAVHYSRIMPSF